MNQLQSLLQLQIPNSYAIYVVVLLYILMNFTLMIEVMQYNTINHIGTK